MKLLADIYANIPIKSISSSYTYIIPERFSFALPGCRAVVPFNGRNVEGFIVAVREEEAPPNIELKKIVDLIDVEPYFSAAVMRTAHFISEHYFCSLGEALRLFIPGKNTVSIEPFYFIEGNLPLVKNNLAQEICDFLEKQGGSTHDKLRRKFSGTAWEKELRLLLNARVLRRDFCHKENGKGIYENIYSLADCVDDVFLAQFSKRRRAQLAALREIKRRGEIKRTELQEAGISSSTVSILKNEGLLKVRQKQIFRDSYAQKAVLPLPEIELTKWQKEALLEIEAALAKGQAQVFLLHGVTGSGKTQVYLEMARRVMQNGRQTLILVPEIVLTGQLVAAAKRYFAEQVAVIHSRLTIGERNDTFLKIRRGMVKVVIGARSALFAPFHDLGAIVADEEHDPSYKQDEPPRYHAIEIARQMAKVYGAILVLGSATPSMESYYRAQSGQYKLLSLPCRIDGRALPQVQSVDMREQLHLGNRNVLSYPLQNLIQSTLEKKEQMIIMLNRRGFSTFVMCRSCGYVAKCTECNLPLVYHQPPMGAPYLQCHHCDIRAAVPDECPKCQSRYIKFFGTGTEKLERELKELYPQANIARLDRDTTAKKFAHDNILRSFRAGRYDILLGTQMVAKGHDIPNVTGVGIISADAGLNLPDFRAAERCFDLITQTAGRAGRGKKEGTVIIQTYNPEHYAVQFGMHQDYQGFYKEELMHRRLFGFPPYAHLIKLTVQEEKEECALKKAMQIAQDFRAAIIAQDGQIIGPAPAKIAILRGIYRYNLLIKAHKLEKVAAFLRAQGLEKDGGVQIDVNPLDIF